ncbi:MAG: hypothetical protein Q9180_008570, partial [Flavoplaca navasiana]
MGQSRPSGKTTQIQMRRSAGQPSRPYHGYGKRCIPARENVWWEAICGLSQPVNGNTRQSPNTAVTQGELIRQEQEAGVVPVPMARSTAPLDTGRRKEDADEEEVVPHARGPEVIGMEDMGPQALSSGFDVEAALGRKGEGEGPPLRKPPEATEETNKEKETAIEKEREKDGEGDVELVDADGNMEGDERKADSVGQNVGSDT